jgi:hypothetical protein
MYSDRMTSPHIVSMAVSLDDLDDPLLGHVHAWRTEYDRVLVSISLALHVSLTGSPALPAYLRDAADRIDAALAGLAVTEGSATGPGDLVEGGALAGGEGGDV